ncbi:hypothetical protein F5890DRAFT_1490654 [Lentinula detonsa]|uniref:Uncharacterized protein n=1 Tax=Lentinula detonsa TaxID=2804962 RepID=A0AA38Q8P9_9AGAR|nr:hypothetical protein F5890DRAFT_1490654 [Lentinula detonsa]
MGRPLWSTVYAAPSNETLTKTPRTWDPTNPFDPDSDAFFTEAEVERPVAEAQLMTEPDSQSYSSRGSVERLDSLEGLIATQRWELLNIMLQQRRAEALVSIRTARAAIDNQRQAEQTEPHSTPQPSAPSSNTLAQPSVASTPGLPSARPVLGLSESRPVQVEVDSDDDSNIEVPMQFAPSGNRRPRESSSVLIDRQNASNRQYGHAARRVDVNMRQAENSELALMRERRRTRLRELAQMLHSVHEGPDERLDSLSLRERRGLLYSRLASLRSGLASIPTPTTSELSPELEASETQRSMAIARSVLRAQRHPEMEPRNHIHLVDLGLPDRP